MLPLLRPSGAADIRRVDQPDVDSVLLTDQLPWVSVADQ